MATFKHINHTQRNYECTNVIACVGDSAPDSNWVECDDSIITNLTQLWIINGVRFYGYL